MKQIVFGYKHSFMEYFDKRFPRRGHEGMEQRYLICYSRIHMRKQYILRELNKTLAFFLYPALIRYSRQFKERYYTPGTGMGYLKAKAEFGELCKFNPD